MAFKEVSIKEEIENLRQESPEFRKMWDDSREEYRLIGEMVALRKKQKMTQSNLAELTGNKQQVISRIETKEMMPTLRMFCNILGVLGYELKIVKKSFEKGSI